MKSVALALGILLLALAAPAEAANVVVKKSQKGMTYSLRVPDGWDRTQGGLLVLAFHGRGQSHDLMMPIVQGFDWLKDAVIAAPNASRDKVWGPQDVDAAAALILELQRELHAVRTISFGFSAGAFFTCTLGVMHPELLSAGIPHSGGVPQEMSLVPRKPRMKEVAFFFIHGDKDSIVDVKESREGSKRLKDWGVKQVEYEELKGQDHVIDRATTRKAFDWVERTLGPLAKTLSDAEAAERTKALEKAIKAKDADATVKAFEACANLPRRARAAVASLAKGQFASTDEKVAAAAIECCGGLGDEGVSALRTLAPANERLAPQAAEALGKTWSSAAVEPLVACLRCKSSATAGAGASALGELGGDAALAGLVGGLSFAEQMKEKDDRDDAIREALKKLTGQYFEKAADAKAWLAENR